jgi:hypothetical protein
VPCDHAAVVLCLLLQLIPVITASGHRASKLERMQVLQTLLRDKSMRGCPGAKVTRWCGCVKSKPASIELFPAGNE